MAQESAKKALGKITKPTKDGKAKPYTDYDNLEDSMYRAYQTNPEVYTELVGYLGKRGKIPEFNRASWLEMRSAAGMFEHPTEEGGRGRIVLRRPYYEENNRKPALASTTLHELTHAVNKELGNQYAQLMKKGEKNQFTEAYEKLMMSPKREFFGPRPTFLSGAEQLMEKLDPKWRKKESDYRATTNEGLAFAVGSSAGKERDMFLPPAHLDPTLATNLRILVDLANRSVDKKAEKFAKGGEAMAQESSKSLLEKLDELPAKAADKLTELALKAYSAVSNKESLPANQKVFLDTFVDKNKGQITEKYFNEAELRALGNMIASKGGEKGSIRYDDYASFMKPSQTSARAGVLKAGANPYESVRTTLGQFNYRKDPTTQQYVVEDKYDFNRLMTPKAGTTKTPEDVLMMSDYVAQPEVINPANMSPYSALRLYAGRNMPEGQGRPVSINVPKFAKGGEAVNEPSVTNLIRAEAQKQGVNPDLAVKIANVESGLDPSAKNPKSSASGLFQIIDRTRKELGGDPKKRMDPLENVRLGVKLIKQNEGQLMSSLGRRPTDHELYMAHMFGPTGAVNLIQADPSMPVSKAVLQFSSPKTAEAIVKNNRLTGTVGDVIGQFRQKFGVKPAVQQKTAPVNKKPAAPEGPVPFQTGFDLVAQAPSYQAALAMASLASLEDEDTEKEDKTPVAEEVQPPSAAQMLAGLQMPSLQAFATGGAVSQQPRRRAAPGTLDDAAAFYASMQTPVLSEADRAELERRTGGASGFGAYETQVAGYRERLGELAPIVDEYNRRIEAYQGTFARDAAGNVITSSTYRPGYTLYEGGVYAQRSVDPRASITGFERPVAGAGRLSPFERYSTYCDSGGCYEVVAATGFDYVNPQGERINIRTDVDPYNLFRARRTVTNYGGPDFSYDQATGTLNLYESAPVRPSSIPDSPTPTGLVGTKAELEALYSASQERAAQGAAQRSTALQAVSQRNPYNLAGFSTDFSNINRPTGALFADGGPVNKDELVAPPVVVTPEEKPKTESKRMLDKLLEARKEATSTIPGMAADIAASTINPVYGTAASAADFETARRENDLLGMGLAGAGMVPVFGGMVRGGGKLLQRIGKEGAESGGVFGSKEALKSALGDFPAQVKQAWFDLTDEALYKDPAKMEKVLDEATRLDLFKEEQINNAKEAIDLFKKKMIDEETLDTVLTKNITGPLTNVWSRLEKQLGRIKIEIPEPPKK